MTRAVRVSGHSMPVQVDRLRGRQGACAEAVKDVRPETLPVRGGQGRRTQRGTGRPARRRGGPGTY